MSGGVRLGNLYCDPLLTSGGHKITARQRWTPTPVQLQILERIFDQGNGTPTKQKIKEITSQLGQHGHISETNVYNWFQNRRARSKRKHQNTTPPPAESELDTEVEIEVEVDSQSQSQSQSQSPKDKKTRPHHHHHHASAPQDIGFQGTEILHFFDPHTSKAEPMFQSNAPSRPSRNLPQMPFYDGLLSLNRLFLFYSCFGSSPLHIKILGRIRTQIRLVYVVLSLDHPFPMSRISV